MPALMVRSRVDTLKAFGRREADVFRTVASDVKQRAVMGMEPSGTRGLGGLLGQRGSLLKEPVPVIVKTMDNVFALVQENAAINRRQVGR